MVDMVFIVVLVVAMASMVMTSPLGITTLVKTRHTCSTSLVSQCTQTLDRVDQQILQTSNLHRGIKLRSQRQEQ